MADQSADNNHRGRRSNLLPALVVAAAALVGGHLAASGGDSDASAAPSVPSTPTSAPTSAPSTTPPGPPLPAWSYDGLTNGPAHWADLDPTWAACADVTGQSPIQIQDRTAGPVGLQFSYASTAAKVTFDGRVVRLGFSPGSGIVLDGVRYDLVSGTLHTPSEHTVDGDGFDAELQLLHRNAKGDLAEVALLISRGERNPLFDPLFEALDSQVGHAEPTLGPLALADLLPPDRTAVRYTGSLTTPPCTGHVEWVVLTHTASASSQQLQAATALTTNSARPAQPVAKRPVISG